jgi:hypothetical protein
MDRTKALAQLEAVKTAMHEQHPTNPARLEQLDSHLATAAMAVEHLFDEADRG